MAAFEEAYTALCERSRAAIAGAGGTGSAEVPDETALLLLSGVAADSEQVLGHLKKVTVRAMNRIADGDDPLYVVSGSLLQALLLGALIGYGDDA